MELELNKVYNCGCMELMKNIPSESIDLIVTDPPYKVTSRGGSGTMGGYWKGEKAKKGTIFNFNDISCRDYLPEFYRILKNKSILYLMCNHTNLQEMLNVGTACGFKFVKCLIWEKGNKICGRYYMNCFEYIILFRKGGDKPIKNCGTPDILKVPIKKMKDSSGKNLHDTEKPADLMKILIENSSDEGGVVFDPFMGSFTTAVACLKLKRKFLGAEIDEEHYKNGIERLENEKMQISMFD